MHACIFTYIRISTYVCSVCRRLPICMFSGMTVWHWTTVWCARPWGGPPLPLPAFVCVGWGFRSFSSPSMSVDVILAQLTFRQSCWWDFAGVASANTRRHSFTANSLICCFLESFCLLFQSMPWTLGGGVLCRCAYWNGAPQLCMEIGCGFLPWSPSVAKRSPLLNS